MGDKFFGTDGVRGQANSYPMTADIALRLGAAVGRYFRRDVQEHRVVIGKDTRLSGYMLENALTAGFTSTGMNVFLLGPVPTPAIGYLTRSMRADVGVMISASHNPAIDNGIKFFGPDGFKLSDEAQDEIERMLHAGVEPAQPQNIGRAKRIDDAGGRYVEYAKTTFPKHLRLDGLKIVIDCANGAAHRVAPAILWELGAEVIKIGTDPNGFNINEGCGSTQPQVAAARVVAEGADIGICLDGDADRVILVDEKGQIIDGDQIMAVIATRWAQAGRLAHNTLVATVMSNLGLERHLAAHDVQLLRTAVGDRYVVEQMRQGGYNLGGEQSGHMVMTDYGTTGDGLIAALQVLAALVEENGAASDLLAQYTPVPQKLVNLRYAAGAAPLDAPSVQTAISHAQQKLSKTGRLLVRKSGTEPLIRLMAEAEDTHLLDQVLADLQGAIEGAA